MKRYMYITIHINAYAYTFQSDPNYKMSSFQLSKAHLKKMNDAIMLIFFFSTSFFFWGSKDGRSKLHFLKKEVLRKPTRLGDPIKLFVARDMASSASLTSFFSLEWFLETQDAHDSTNVSLEDNLESSSHFLLDCSWLRCLAMIF